MSEANFAIYKKPQKSEYERTFDEQVKNKPKRLWPGKLPQFPEGRGIKEEESDDDIFDAKKQEYTEERQIAQTAFIEENQYVSEGSSQHGEIEIEDVDEDALIKRRQLMRERADVQIIPQEEMKKQKQKKNKKHKIKKVKIEESVQQNIDEQEEDEADDDIPQQRDVIKLLKPVFVSRTDRDKQDKKLEEEERIKEEKTKMLERQKLENRMMLVQTVQAQEMQEVDSDEDQKVPLPNDDDDETQDAHEYGLWKIRELKRLKKEHDERTKLKREKQEIERRRNLTDEQRIEEDFKLGSDKTKVEDKTQYVYMQKYYHKGVFFQDNDDPIFQRDFNLPVGEDLWDKSQLPSILQKRRGIFGKKAQSKYTHLTDQDTTDYDPSYQVDEGIRQKFFMRQAGNRSQNKFDQFFNKRN